MMDSRKIKILITGGHVTPALAIIEDIRRRFPQWEVVLAGRSKALEGEKVSSEEMRLASLYRIRFIPIQTGRITRIISPQTFFSFLKTPWGFVQALRMVARERPTLIVSFGGYIAFPVVVAGWLWGIPSVTHEQTRTFGLTNRLIGSMAKKIAISFSDQLGQYPKEKVVYTGLPLRSGLFQSQKKAPAGIQTNLPLLFITGGSTGARSMNELVFPLVGTLTKKYMVVHQTGTLSLHKAREVRKHLSESEQRRYAVFGYIDMPDYAWILVHARLVVGRSGANTVGEVAALGKVAIWIPLPWSAGGEQQENARYLVRAGSAGVLDQKTLTPPILAETIEHMMTDFESFRVHAANFAQTMPRDGATRMVNVISEAITA